jgi:hypothetical protein
MPECAHINPTGMLAGTDTLDVQWSPVLIDSSKRNTPNELVPLIDVEDQDPMAAILKIVANAGRRHVQQTRFRGIWRIAYGTFDWTLGTLDISATGSLEGQSGALLELFERDRKILLLNVLVAELAAALPNETEPRPFCQTAGVQLVGDRAPNDTHGGEKVVFPSLVSGSFRVPGGMLLKFGLTAGSVTPVGNAVKSGQLFKPRCELTT